jgi:hypothetical protein
MNSDLDRAISELERTSLELARSVSHRDPSFAGMIHARHEATLALRRCDLSAASPGHLARLRAVLLLGRQVERSIRKWRQTAVDEISALGYQARMARAERNPTPAGAILDLKI